MTGLISPSRCSVDMSELRPPFPDPAPPPPLLPAICSYCSLTALEASRFILADDHVKASLVADPSRQWQYLRLLSVLRCIRSTCRSSALLTGQMSV